MITSVTKASVQDETSLVLYADDTALIFDNVEKLKEAINIINQYSNAHEIKINAAKTRCLTTARRIRRFALAMLENKVTASMIASYNERTRQAKT